VGDGPQPPELETLRRLDRYGSPAIYGRVLGVREIRRMEMAARTVNAYLGMHASKDWIEWQKQHPSDFEFLTYAIKLYKAR